MSFSPPPSKCVKGGVSLELSTKGKHLDSFSLISPLSSWSPLSCLCFHVTKFSSTALISATQPRQLVSFTTMAHSKPLTHMNTTIACLSRCDLCARNEAHTLMTSCSHERTKRTIDFLIRYSIQHVFLNLQVQQDPNFLNFLRMGTLVFGLLAEMAASFILERLSRRSGQLLTFYYPLNVSTIHVHAATTTAVAAGYLAFLESYNIPCFRWTRNAPPSLLALADRIKHRELLVDPIVAQLELEDDLIRRVGVSPDLLERINRSNLPYLQMALRSYLPACAEAPTVYYWDPESIHLRRDRVEIHWPALHQLFSKGQKRDRDEPDSDDEADEPKQASGADNSLSTLSCA